MAFTGGVFGIGGQLWTVFGQVFNLFWPQKWRLLAVFLGLVASFGQCLDRFLIFFGHKNGVYWRCFWDWWPALDSVWTGF